MIVMTDHDLHAQLARAAAEGQTQEALALLDQGASLGALDSTQATALHYAASRGQAETVVALIARGACIEAVDGYGRMPLHLATEKEDQDTLRALLQANACVEARDRYHRTPLHYAAKRGDLDVILMLLEAGACVDCRDKAQTTPLRTTVLREWTLATLGLIAGGATDGPALKTEIKEVSAPMRDILDLDALRAAARLGHQPLLARALQSPEFQALDPEVWTARLRSAVQYALGHYQPNAAGYLRAVLAHRAMTRSPAPIHGVRPL